VNGCGAPAGPPPGLGPASREHDRRDPGAGGPPAAVLAV